MDEKELYAPESAGGLMIRSVPTSKRTDTVSDVMFHLSHKDWANVHAVYVLSEDQVLLGILPIARLLGANGNEAVDGLMVKPKLTMHPNADQEKVVINAIKADVESVPIVDDNKRFLGVVLADKIIDVLHAEHLEDFLRSTGIRGKGSHILELATSNLFHIVLARLPWLIVGVSAGLGLGIIASRFQGSLQEDIALAFFIPVIAYVADSVGTQTETIFIRAWAVLKINPITYILKELLVGVIMGIILGTIGGFGAIVISGTPLIGVVVGISLFIAITLATVLACLVPMTFKALGKDPALGSGPLATVLQDSISLLVYFVIASLIL